MKKFSICSCLFFFLLVTNAVGLSFNMQDAPLIDLIEWVSQATGKNIILSSDINQNVSFNIQNVEKNDIWPFFETLLNAYNLSLVDKGHFYQVKRIETALVDLVPPGPQHLLQGDPAGVLAAGLPPVEILGQAYALDNVSFESVQAALTVMIGPAGKVVGLPGSRFYVMAEQSQLDSLSDLLPLLDVAQKRVLVEAVIFETSSKDFSEVGLTVKAFFDSLAGASTFATNRLPGSSLSWSRTDFQGLVTALSSLDQVRMLSTPQIIVNDGEQGSMIVGQNVPFITGRSVGAAGDAETPFQTIERVDVGVSLSVKPLVVSDNLIDLLVTQSASSVTDDTSASDLITNTRRLTSRLSLAPGQWVALGGLISEDLIKSTSGVPVLMHLPYLGRAFRVDRHDQVNRQLSVILRVSFV